MLILHERYPNLARNDELQAIGQTIIGRLSSDRLEIQIEDPTEEVEREGELAFFDNMQNDRLENENEYENDEQGGFELLYARPRPRIRLRNIIAG